jgi:ribonucleoside-diphosphate reductase alpha chain
VRIGGQRVYLTVGEYPDGRPGEIWIDAARQGTFVRGTLSAVARLASIALQCGADVGMVIHSLRGANYPPHGLVEGSEAVTQATSVTDWVAAELEAQYGDRAEPESGVT